VENVRSKTATRVASVQRAAAAPVAVQSKPAASVAAPVVQASSLRVSSPKDPAEKEADRTAAKVMRMAIPEGSIGLVAGAGGSVFRQVQARFVSPYVARFASSGWLQRKSDGPREADATLSTELRNSMSGGSPLPLSVRRFMEPRFRADFSRVKVHTGDRAASLSQQLSARAFTIGNNVFFGRGQFRPESRDGKELIAHELTHTIQQGGVAQRSPEIQRSEDVTVTQQAPTQVQRDTFDSILGFFADNANNIPGFRMFTIVLGVNPITMAAVDRSAANILRAVVEFMPGGALITTALDKYGVFEKAGTWVEQQLASLGMTGAAIKQAVTTFLKTLGPMDLFSPSGVWTRAKSILSEPIDRIKSFLKGIAAAVIQFVKDAILKPLANLASQTAGWDLLKAVLGRDPITGDAVPRTAETLIGGFMKFIGQEEVWENIKKGKAIDRAWAWFQSALASLMGFVEQLPGLFIAALKSLVIED
jgi:hypothetical protein